MKKIAILAGVSCLILISILVVVMALIQGLPDKNNPYTHSFTKAICNEENLCQDYELICKDKSLLSMGSTGFAVQFSKGWHDPRTDELKNKNC